MTTKGAVLLALTMAGSAFAEMHVRIKHPAEKDFVIAVIKDGEAILGCRIEKGETCCCDQSNKDCQCKEAWTKVCHPKGRPPYKTHPSKACRP